MGDERGIMDPGNGMIRKRKKTVRGKKREKNSEEKMNVETENEQKDKEKG